MWCNMCGCIGTPLWGDVLGVNAFGKGQPELEGVVGEGLPT